VDACVMCVFSCMYVNCFKIFQFWAQMVGFYKCCNEISLLHMLSMSHVFEKISAPLLSVTSYLPTVDASYL